jgi:hypothetical protein
MQSLAEKPPIFHSEADFQHALAWELHLAEPEAQVRLEYRPVLAGRMYVDIWLESSGGLAAIELKYPTKCFSVVGHDGAYELRDHSAQDLVRHDFVKDLARLEQIGKTLPAVSATAIMLTNDPLYWKPARAGNQIDLAFRIHEGRVLEGTLAWGAHAGEGTTANRREPLGLNLSYELHWRDYSAVDDTFGRFRYLLVNVS